MHISLNMLITVMAMKKKATKTAFSLYVTGSDLKTRLSSGGCQIRTRHKNCKCVISQESPYFGLSENVTYMGQSALVSCK